ncbi:WD repeat-containing protein 17 [Frankliniella fusca]|uniref:WD repeat-containing protein 17 n=1 Tax=Frankliniella fusca TaxID=407009 RepID=A0AAE1LRA7_9NEOP|nr:WD repeat-containing protein 17 [Frankliniella fusca]
MAMRRIKNNAGNSTGTLFLDEVALTERVNFERDSTNARLSECREVHPEADKTKKGDHAFEFMFQPLRQGRNCSIFKNRSSQRTSGAETCPGSFDIAEKCWIFCRLCHDRCSNLEQKHVEPVRSLLNSCNVNSCEHPVDPIRFLYFALMKRLWTRVVNNKVLEVPDGLVKLAATIPGCGEAGRG